MVKSLDERIEKLLSKTECMVLLCSKASSYWSMVKFAFNIPLVLTSSAMCIINSISEDANEVKIPNIVVNAISVLIMSLNNSIKASEKCDLFRRHTYTHTYMCVCVCVCACVCVCTKRSSLEFQCWVHTAARVDSFLSVAVRHMSSIWDPHSYTIIITSAQLNLGIHSCASERCVWMWLWHITQSKEPYIRMYDKN